MAGAVAALLSSIVAKARRRKCVVALTVDVQSRCCDGRAVRSRFLMAILASRSDGDVEAVQTAHLSEVSSRTARVRMATCTAHRSIAQRNAAVVSAAGAVAVKVRTTGCGVVFAARAAPPTEIDLGDAAGVIEGMPDGENIRWLYVTLDAIDHRGDHRRYVCVVCGEHGALARQRSVQVLWWSAAQVFDPTVAEDAVGSPSRRIRRRVTGIATRLTIGTGEVFSVTPATIELSLTRRESVYVGLFEPGGMELTGRTRSPRADATGSTTASRTAYAT